MSKTVEELRKEDAGPLLDPAGGPPGERLLGIADEEEPEGEEVTEAQERD
jgi:hypothetical protein